MSTLSFILPNSIKEVPGIPRDLVLKSEVSIQGASAALWWVNPIHKKES